MARLTQADAQEMMARGQTEVWVCRKHDMEPRRGELVLWNGGPEIAVHIHPQPLDVSMAYSSREEVEQIYREQMRRNRLAFEEEFAESEKRIAACSEHRWRMISHEERECVKCGAVEFIPDC